MKKQEETITSAKQNMKLSKCDWFGIKRKCVQRIRFVQSHFTFTSPSVS